MLVVAEDQTPLAGATCMGQPPPPAVQPPCRPHAQESRAPHAAKPAARHNKPRRLRVARRRDPIPFSMIAVGLRLILMNVSPTLDDR